MLVDPKDGTCPYCGGQMMITGADDVSLDTDCTECLESFHVEIDYFNDGGVTYWPAMMAQLEEEEA